ncbi:hypothetical protein TNCV_2129761 [Trichonephila clavipes]|nr:hypothetical protein TNCV_2129761 [Trichonephila clavipes]
MFDPSSFAGLTPRAHADTSRDVLPRGGLQTVFGEEVMSHEMVGYLYFMFDEGKQIEGQKRHLSGSTNENNIARVQDMLYLNDMEASKFSSEENILTKQC